MTDKISIENIEENADTQVCYSEYQSVKHFCILCILSLGLYPFFWFYKHWQFLRDEKKLDINASFRTVLTVFYGYSLFKIFYGLAVEKGYKTRPAFEILFILYLVSSIFSRIQDNYWGLISLFTFVFLIPIHRMMNFYYLNEQPNYKIRDKLGKGEKVFLIIFWVIIIFVSIN